MVFVVYDKLPVVGVIQDLLSFMTLIAERIVVSSNNSLSINDNLSILAPSDFAMAGSGWVSMNIPSAPAAIAAFPIVEIISGTPPVTPDSWFGCCNERVMSIITG